MVSCHEMGKKWNIFIFRMLFHRSTHKMHYRIRFWPLGEYLAEIKAVVKNSINSCQSLMDGLPMFSAEYMLCRDINIGTKVTFVCCCGLILWQCCWERLGPDLLTYPHRVMFKFHGTHVAVCWKYRGEFCLWKTCFFLNSLFWLNIMSNTCVRIVLLSKIG